MKVIAGLGNPGREYVHTPHNAGFMALEALAGMLGVTLRRSFRFKARIGKAVVAGVPVVLVQPLTYMNVSGDAVGPVMAYYHVGPEDLVVISDDADLPLGVLRVRRKGSSGGHNGLKSIAERLGTEDFTRVRVGIGRDARADALVAHVLRKMEEERLEALAAAARMAAAAVRTVLTDGVDAAMNRFNARPSAQADEDTGGAGGST